MICRDFLSLAVINATTYSSGVNEEIAIGHTRIVSDREKKPVNASADKYPALAHGWIDNAEIIGLNDQRGFIPPILQIDKNKFSQILIQTLSSTSPIAKLHELLLCFKIQKMPSKGSEPNSLQLALKNSIKPSGGYL